MWLPLHDDGRTVAEQALVDGQADLRALDLATGGLASQLPRQLAHLGDGLGGNGFAEAREATRRVDRDAPTDRRVTVVDEPLGLALLAQADVLVPVELER